MKNNNDIEIKINSRIESIDGMFDAFELDQCIDLCLSTLHMLSIHKLDFILWKNRKSYVYCKLGELYLLKGSKHIAYFYLFKSITLRADYFKPYSILFKNNKIASKIAIIRLHIYVLLVGVISLLVKRRAFLNYVKRLNIVLARISLEYGASKKAGYLFNNASKIINQEAVSLYWLGYYYFCIQDYERAINEYSKVLDISPGSSQGVNGLINCYCQIGDFESAYQVFKQHSGVVSELLIRNIFFGLRDYSTSYYYARDNKTTRILAQKIPNYISSFSGIDPSKTLVVLAIWGIGDEIRWSVIYPMLSKIFRNIKVTCEPRLLKVLADTYPSIEFIPVERSFDGKVHYKDLSLYNELPKSCLSTVLTNDIYVSLQNENIQFTTMLDVLSFVFSNNSYLNYKRLQASSNLTTYWKDRVNQLGCGVKVGICWKSGNINQERNIHYFHIALWEQVLRVSGVEFINLQYEDYCDDIRLMKKKGLEIHRFSGLDLKNDIDSLAALMMNLDLVISPCTAVIELAGALGLKGFMLSNSGESYGRIDSDGYDKWHPTIKHILPDVIGNKDSLMHKLYQELSIFVNANNS